MKIRVCEPLPYQNFSSVYRWYADVSTSILSPGTYEQADVLEKIGGRQYQAALHAGVIQEHIQED